MAHGLAKSVVLHIMDSIWLEETLPIVFDIVLRESSIPKF
jgi:hypothetical protein